MDKTIIKGRSFLYKGSNGSNRSVMGQAVRGYMVRTLTWYYWTLGNPKNTDRLSLITEKNLDSNWFLDRYGPMLGLNPFALFISDDFTDKIVPRKKSKGLFSHDWTAMLYNWPAKLCCFWYLWFYKVLFGEIRTC